MNVGLRTTPAVSLLMAALFIAGCSEDESSPTPRARPDQVPAGTEIPAGKVVLGFALGKLRATADVETFSITTTPVTVGQYRQCVEAGVCAKPSWDTAVCRLPFGALEGPTYDRGAEDVPVTCASPPQAKKFCAWLGGRLPTAAEWFLAARGTTPARYAWGGETPSCNRQWRLSWSDDSCCAEECSSPAVAAVGKHPDGISKSGLMDVLSTPAELVGKGGPAFGLCSKFGCLATGLSPGAIDTFMPLDSDLEDVDRQATLDQFRRVAPTTGFRCVLSEGGK